MTDQPVINKTYRHKKSGGVYRIVCISQTEEGYPDSPVLVSYQNVETGEIWTRPAADFFDGRFETFMKPKAK